MIISELARLGRGHEEMVQELKISWLIDLDAKGNQLGPPVAMVGDDGKPVPMDAPSVKRTRGPAALPGTDRVDRVYPSGRAHTHENWLSLVTEAALVAPDLQALLAWAASGAVAVEDMTADQYVAFRVAGRFVHDDPALIAWWTERVITESTSDRQGQCSVCGQVGKLLELLPMGVRKLGDATFVSANQPAFGRGGRGQLADSPLCVTCGPAAVAGLTMLLNDPHSRFYFNDSYQIWWVDQDTPPLDLLVLNQPSAETVAQFINHARQGQRRGTPSGGRFRSVKVSRNQARIIFSHVTDTPLQRTLDSLAHWLELATVDDGFGPQTVSLWQLRDAPLPRKRSKPRKGPGAPKPSVEIRKPKGASALAAQANLYGQLWVCATTGAPLPAHLVHNTLIHIESDGVIDASRVALLQIHVGNQKETSMTPDQRSAYALGQLLALAESAQDRGAWAAKQSVPARGLVDTLFSMVSRTPRLGVVRLDEMTSPWLAKLRRYKNDAAATAIQSRMEQVFTDIDSDLPMTFGADAQAQLVLGLWHMRATLRAEFAAAIAAKKAKAATDSTSKGDKK